MSTKIVRPASSNHANSVLTGAATRHEALDDVVTQPTAPGLTDYVSLGSNATSWVEILTFAEAQYTEEYITDASVWIYVVTPADKTMEIRPQLATRDWTEQFVTVAESFTGWVEVPIPGRFTPYDLAQLSVECHFDTGTPGGTSIDIHAMYLEITCASGVPTRFGLSKGSTPPISPAFDALWDVTGSAQRRLLDTDTNTDATAIDSSPPTFAKGDTVANKDVLFGQWVSRPLVAQEISGTMRCILRVMQTLSSQDCMPQIVAKVVSNDGSVVRGTLFAGDTSSTVDAGEFATSASATKFPRPALYPATLTPVDAQDGDRLLIEVGYRGVAAANPTVTASLGDRHPATTHARVWWPECESADTVTHLSTGHFPLPWVEFSQTLKWQQPTPQKWYLGRGVMAPISPSPEADWDKHSDKQYRAMRRLSDPTINTAIQVEDTTGFQKLNTANTSTLGLVFVSPPLDPQTITGTVKGQILASVSASTADMISQMMIKVVSNDGSVVRGTALEMNTTASLTANNEWPTTKRNRKMPVSDGSPYTLTEVEAQSGDRLVVEMGFKNFTNGTQTGRITRGDNYSTVGDLPDEDDSGTGANDTNLRPWLQFSNPIYLQGELATEEPAITNPIMMLV